MSGWYFAGAILLLLLGLWVATTIGGNNDKDKW